jgi:hypothetical protein
MSCLIRQVRFSRELSKGTANPSTESITHMYFQARRLVSIVEFYRVIISCSLFRYDPPIPVPCFGPEGVGFVSRRQFLYASRY